MKHWIINLSNKLSSHGMEDLMQRKVEVVERRIRCLVEDKKEVMTIVVNQGKVTYKKTKQKIMVMMMKTCTKTPLKRQDLQIDKKILSYLR